MKGYVTNIEKEALDNDDFRRVLFTDKKTQLVLMSLRPGEETGEEVHKVDQFIRIEYGAGKAVLDGETFVLRDGTALVVPKGTKHNIINTATEEMKLYTVYAPPHHKHATVHKTKEEAENDENDTFDGKTTE